MVMTSKRCFFISCLRILTEGDVTSFLGLFKRLKRLKSLENFAKVSQIHCGPQQIWLVMADDICIALCNGLAPSRRQALARTPIIVSPGADVITNWGGDIFQTTFANIFSWMKLCVSSWQWVSIGSGKGLDQTTSYHLNQWWHSFLIHIHHSASMN